MKKLKNSYTAPLAAKDRKKEGEREGEVAEGTMWENTWESTQ